MVLAACVGSRQRVLTTTLLKKRARGADAPTAASARDATKLAVDYADDLAFALSHPEVLLDDYQPPAPLVPADITNSAAAVAFTSAGVAANGAARGNIENTTMATAAEDMQGLLRLRDAELGNLRSRLADKQRDIEQVTRARAPQWRFGLTRC